jgi:TATA-box binding protein (TBP) (component of TFIID and TFIIIB)
MPAKTKARAKKPLKSRSKSIEKPVNPKQQILTSTFPEERPRVEEIEIFARNVVTTFTTKCMLNLREIGQQGPNVEYERGGNNLLMRIRTPQTTAIIFPSGKINCVGAKSEADAYKAARRYCRILQKIKPKVKLANYRVVNVLASCSLPFTVEIRRLAYEHQRNCSYEPEMNAGAVFRLQHLSVTATIFNSGKINMTAPCVLAARQALSHLFPILYEFKKEYILKPVPPLVSLDENNNEASCRGDFNRNQVEPNSKPVEEVKEAKSKVTIQPVLLLDEEKISDGLVNNNPVEEETSQNGGCQTEEETATSPVSPPDHYHAHQSASFYQYDESLSYNNDNTMTSFCVQESRGEVLIYNENSNSEHLFAMSSDTMMSSSSYTTSGSNLYFSSSQQTSGGSHWFNENLLIDTVLEDFLP